MKLMDSSDISVIIYIRAHNCVIADRTYLLAAIEIFTFKDSVKRILSTQAVRQVGLEKFTFDIFGHLSHTISLLELEVLNEWRRGMED